MTTPAREVFVSSIPWALKVDTNYPRKKGGLISCTSGITPTKIDSQHRNQSTTILKNRMLPLPPLLLLWLQQLTVNEWEQAQHGEWSRDPSITAAFDSALHISSRKVASKAWHEVVCNSRPLYRIYIYKEKTRINQWMNSKRKERECMYKTNLYEEKYMERKEKVDEEKRWTCSRITYLSWPTSMGKNFNPQSKRIRAGDKIFWLHRVIRRSL